MSKIDLKDTTFTIPVRYDTDDRILNLTTALEYITHHFDTNIIVLENDKSERMRGHLTKWIDNGQVKYIFEKEDNAIFHRTRILNTMAKIANTPVIVNYDADIVLRVPQYIVARNGVVSGQCDACTAFSSYTMNVPKNLHEKIKESKSVEWLHENMCHVPHKFAVAKGGVVFWNKQKFIEVGMENENFLSWGPEDQERVERCIKLGYKWARVQGPLYHLDHARLLNSGDSHKFAQQNDAEFEKIKRFSPEELRSYIKGWSWIQK